MRLKFPIIWVLMLVCISLGASTNISSANASSYLSFEDHVLTSFHKCIEGVNQAGIRGPLAEEITRWAIVRQLHENGLDRGHTYCVPGISCGSWNKDTLDWCLKRVPNDVKVTRIKDSEGMALYELKGHNANVVSTAAVAMLFDYYVQHFSWFTKEEKEVWDKSKAYSELINYGAIEGDYLENYNQLYDSRQKILAKCNGGYGPGRDRIVGEVKKLAELFDYTLKTRK